MRRTINLHMWIAGRIYRRRLRQTEGSAVLEFAIASPLLVVFIVGIFDFSGAFDLKQKIAQAAQEGAIVAAAQPTSDIDVSDSNPGSLQPVVAAVFNSLAGSGVLVDANVGRCKLTPPPKGAQTGGTLTWTYDIRECSGYTHDTTPGCNGSTSDRLWIVVNRGWVDSAAAAPIPVGTSVTVSYDYHWRFNSAIQLLFPSATYSPKTCVTETATVHNQT
ncbi:MAG: TadE/TadG family type IV pilus assembly protein [Terriglobales bacterium]|jgi:Flp pilus assembly protein TadG